MYKRVPYVWICALIGIAVGVSIPFLVLVVGRIFPDHYSLANWMFGIFILTLLPVAVIAELVRLPTVVYALIYAALWGGAFALIGKFTQSRSKKMFLVSAMVFILLYGLIGLAILSSPRFNYITD